MNDNVIHKLETMKWSESFVRGYEASTDGSAYVLAKDTMRGMNLFEVSMPGLNFTQVRIEDCTLTLCSLKGGKFERPSIRRTMIVSSDLSDTTFTGGVIDGVTFYGCNLSGSTFKDVEFTGCRFIDCNFHNAVIKDCIFNHPYVEGTDFPEAKFINCSRVYLLEVVSKDDNEPSGSFFAFQTNGAEILIQLNGYQSMTLADWQKLRDEIGPWNLGKIEEVRTRLIDQPGTI